MIAYSYTAILPVTKTYPTTGQRWYALTSPGVMQFDADGNPVQHCMAQVTVHQMKGNKIDLEGYYIVEAKPEDFPPMKPKGQNEQGYVFHRFTGESTEAEPGIYLVRFHDGVATECGCLGARGHTQSSNCKHRDVINHAMHHVVEPQPEEHAVAVNEPPAHYGTEF